MTGPGFMLGLRTVYLREADPEELLRWPGLSILAELARGDHETRFAAALEAVRQIGTLPVPQRRGLYQALMDLGSIHFDVTQLNLILEEIRMIAEGEGDEEVIALYRQTKIGAVYLAEGREEGRQGGDGRLAGMAFRPGRPDSGRCRRPGPSAGSPVRHGCDRSGEGSR
jgi:hypothetical protein